MVCERIMVRLTAAQALRCEKLGECLWPTEKLTVEEVSRRLLLEHLLWQESERDMVEPRERNAPEEHISREMSARIRLPGATLRGL